MNCSARGFPVLHHLLELAQTHAHWVGDAIQLPHPLSPLLLLPLIFPSIRVFSNESALLIRRPKYWSFSFSISPSNEYSVLTSFRTDWFDLFAVPGTLFFFFFYCKICLLVITLYNLLPIFDVTNFRVFEIGRILVCNQYLSSLNCFCDFFLFLPTKTCYVPSINASSKWRNKLG